MSVLELYLDDVVDKDERLSLDVGNHNYEEIKKIANRDEKRDAVEKVKE